MPNLNCLNDEIMTLKKSLELHTQQIEQINSKVDLNTLVTMETKKDTGEIIELMKWGKITRRLILTASSLICSLWALIEGIKHFK